MTCVILLGVCFQGELTSYLACTTSKSLEFELKVLRTFSLSLIQDSNSSQAL